MRIGEVASRSGIPAKTIRYWESIEVVPTPVRAANGYRDYDATVLDRVAFIRAAQVSGFTLGEIRGVVALRDRGENPCDHVRSLIDRRAAELDARIAELQLLRADLKRLAKRAQLLDPTDCDPSRFCHIITPPSQT